MATTDLRSNLEKLHQRDLLAHLEKISPVQRQQLTDQLASLDLNMIGQLIESHVKHKQLFSLPSRIDPVKIYPHHPGNEYSDLYRQAKSRGQQLIKEGKVAAFVVAGGQGTRLGYDGPKGEFPVTPIKQKS